MSIPARWRGGLWRQRDFGLFWTGESISEVGNSVTIVVLPLAAIEILHASTFVITVLNAAVWLPCAVAATTAVVSAASARAIAFFIYLVLLAGAILGG